MLAVFGISVAAAKFRFSGPEIRLKSPNSCVLPRPGANARAGRYGERSPWRRSSPLGLIRVAHIEAGRFLGEGLHDSAAFGAADLGWRLGDHSAFLAVSSR